MGDRAQYFSSIDEGKILGVAGEVNNFLRCSKRRLPPGRQLIAEGKVMQDVGRGEAFCARGNQPLSDTGAVVDDGLSHHRQWDDNGEQD